MPDITSVVVVTVAIIWIGLLLTAYAKVAGYSKKRLLRCPETGSVALVSIEEAKPSGKSTREEPRFKVIQCQLWPERKDCGRGCVTRRDLAAEPHGFDLHALRRFDN